VFYVAVQRAMATGAGVLGNARQVVAGSPPSDIAGPWQQLAGSREVITSDYPHHRGVYLAGDRLLAVNRSAAEEQAGVLEDAQVAALFQGLDFARVDDRAGSLRGLVQEVWRLFLVSMLIALVGEAILCLPKRRPTAGAA
jgi:hypothetical protein